MMKRKTLLAVLVASTLEPDYDFVVCLTHTESHLSTDNELVRTSSWPLCHRSQRSKLKR
jgi:hypothetical protein